MKNACVILGILLTALPGRAALAATNDHTYTVDAMVGQVNGRPIYANKVFDLIDKEMTSLGKQLSPDQFVEQARKVINDRIASMVIDSLVLGDAERDLSEQEQYGLQYMVSQKRQDMVRTLGRGSEAVADASLREKDGTSLDEQLQEYRQTMLVKRYMQRKIMPQINISRKDIERYYARHFKEYNAPQGRTIYMIRTSKLAAAEKIDHLLNSDTPFLEVAGNAELNQNQPAQQGLFGESLRGDSIFGPPELNDPTLKLKAGEHTPRIVFNDTNYWIFVKTISDGTSRSLAEVQGEVEQILRMQRYRELTTQYHQKLFETGSYDPVAQMVDSLVDVAVSRYCLSARER